MPHDKDNKLINNPLAPKRPLHWISMKSGLVRAARETSKFHNCLLLTNSRRLYMVEIFSILGKTLSNQSIIILSSMSLHDVKPFQVFKL